jgi:hypothetical protein
MLPRGKNIFGRLLTLMINYETFLASGRDVTFLMAFGEKEMSEGQ